MSGPAKEGGCHCGALRYRVTAPAEESGYCHCRDCQLTSGAPVLAWAGYPAESFSYTAGTPASYASSARGTREFCPTCSCQILFREGDGPPAVYLNTASLDQPGRGAAQPPHLHPQPHRLVRDCG